MSSSNPFDDFSRYFDRMMRKMDRNIGHVMAKVVGTTTKRNRVQRIVVVDDEGREAGLVTRTDTGWYWSALNLKDTEQKRKSGLETKLPDAVRTMMRTLHE